MQNYKTKNNNKNLHPQMQNLFLKDIAANWIRKKGKRDNRKGYLSFVGGAYLTKVEPVKS